MSDRRMPTGRPERPGRPEAGNRPPPGSDPYLVDLLRAEIERDGPLTFARFMEVALYDPDHGYYATSGKRPTRTGDFLTAPELHPVFGRLLARQIAECWERLGRPNGFTLREYGAGAGTLAIAILRGLAADGSGLARRLRYEPVEVNERRRRDLEERLAAEGLAGSLAGPEGPSDARPPIVGVILANEFLDALPVHRVEGSEAGLRELFVGWDGERFVDVAGAPSTAALAARLESEGVELRAGQRGEVCLGLEPWVAEVAAGLERGWAIVIDYGHPAERLYGRERFAGTLLGYAGHRVVDDPYAGVGRQDLTAHVDLTALERAGCAAGLTVEGTTTQAEFLAGLGLGELVGEAATGSTDGIAAYLDLRGAAVRLLDPRQLGGFAVIVLGCEAPDGPPLRGLTFQISAGADR